MKSPPNSHAYAFWTASLIAIYALLATLVQWLFGNNDVVSFLWVATGVGLAAVLLGGYRYLPALAVGVVLGYLIVGKPLGYALVEGLRQVLVVFLGIWLLRRAGRFDPSLPTLSDYGQVLALALGVGIAAASLMYLMGMVFGPPWAGSLSFNQRWTGHLLGILIVFPLILLWRKPPRAGLRLEAVIIVGLALFTGQLVFNDWLQGTAFSQIARGYWMFFFVTWAAVWLGPHGAILLLTTTALQAMVGAVHEVGFFANDIVKTQLANYFFYMLCLSAVGMALAAYFGQQQRASAELIRTNAELSRSNAELSRLGEVMAHHFQEPARRLSSFAQRLLAKSDLALEEDSRVSLNFIDTESKRLSALVREAQRYLALDHNKVSAAGVVDSALAMRQCIQEAGAPAAEVNIVLHEPLPRVRLSEPMLRTLFAILLDNALRYRNPQRPLRIEVSASTFGARAVFRFTDNGSGIAPQYRAQALGLFTRLVPSSIPGTGMGLALANKIVNLTGGQLHIEDGLDGGACIVFDLPREFEA